MRSLLPEYWKRKEQRHPAGVFQRGPDKNYVVLLADAYGQSPSPIVYHEYVHLLTSLNFRSLPLWLREGLAEFYASSRIGADEVEVGRPNDKHLTLLRLAKLLPLEELFAADETSPDYGDAKRSSIFYAESWALLHYLMLDEEKGGHAPPLAHLLALLRAEEQGDEATRSAVGDLADLTRKLEDYVRRAKFRSLLIKFPGESADGPFAVRSLTPAETLAIRGDFLLHTGRAVEARLLLDEALGLDPALALGYEGMGMLHYRRGESTEAAKWFAQAARLDSRNYLAHYYSALLAARAARDTGSLAQAENGLRRAIELNLNFAAAFAALADVYAARGKDLEEALRLARKAAELDPSAAGYHLLEGRILLKLGRVENALQLGTRVLEESKSPDDRNTVLSFLIIVRQSMQPRPETVRAGTTGTRSEEKLELKPRRGITVGSSVQGRVTAVRCTPPTALFLTVNLGAYTLQLRASDYYKIEYLARTWEPPPRFNPCEHLRARRIRIVYRAASRKPFAGEILLIEVLN